MPLVIRQAVNITNAGSNFTETTDLSTFGFLYGTFPSAPGVFAVASHYNTEIDLVSNYGLNKPLIIFLINHFLDCDFDGCLHICLRSSHVCLSQNDFHHKPRSKGLS